MSEQPKLLLHMFGVELLYRFCDTSMDGASLAPKKALIRRFLGENVFECILSYRQPRAFADQLCAYEGEEMHVER